MKVGVVIGHLTNEGNEGSVIRTAESFGFNNIFVLGKKKKEYFSSCGAYKSVFFHEFDNEEKIVDYSINNNMSIVCIENISSAVDISEVVKYPINPIFVTGNENVGVPQHLLDNSRLIIKIPLGLGYVNCLNTSVALSIILHDFFCKHKLRREEMWETHEV